MSEIEYDPRGTVDSLAITEIRTVLSRARTALETVEKHGAVMVLQPSRYDHGKNEWIEPVTAPLPDGDELVEALRQAVALLSPWERRTSRRRGAR